MIKTGEEVGRWVCRKLFAAYQEGAEGIGLEKEGHLVAGVCYDNWNGRSIMAHIVVDGRLTPSYLYAMFHYPFVHLGVEKIVCPIAQSNKRSIRLCSKMGFVAEAILHDAHPDGDIYLYSMKRSKCRFTGARYGKKFLTACRA